MRCGRLKMLWIKLPISLELFFSLFSLDLFLFFYQVFPSFQKFHAILSAMKILFNYLILQALMIDEVPTGKPPQK